MAILDHNGQPIVREIATIERDITRVFFGNVLRNEDDTLLTRGGALGLKIYDDLARDAHAGALLDKRIRAVTSRPWEVKPASESRKDKKAAELVRAAYEHLKFNRICGELLDAQLKGFSVGEVLWETRDGAVLPRDVVWRNQRRFTFDLQCKLRLLTRESPVDGEELPDRKFIVHRFGGPKNGPFGLGLGHRLFWPVFFKRKGITFWLVFCDKFGSPTAIGKYPAGADAKEQAKLLAALRAISQDAGIIVPDGTLIELLEAARSGSIDTYEKLARYMDEQMSESVLGETMTTTAAGAGLGSNQASVHDDVRIEVAQADSEELGETFDDTLARWIVEYNMPGAGVPKVVRSFAAPEDLDKRADRDKKLTEMGFEPDDEYILETYGPGWKRKPAAPMPPALDPADPPPPPGTKTGDATEEDDPAFAESSTQNRQAQDAMVEAAEQLSAEWKKLMGRRVEDLTAMLESSGDLVTFRERLAELVDGEPSPDMVEAIARSNFAAHIVGRGQPRKPAKTLGQRLRDLMSRRGS